MALLLSRPKQRLHYNPSLINLFSTSSLSPQHGNESGEQPSQSPSSSSSPSDFNISSYFSGIKSSLKQIPPNQLQDGRRQFARFDTEAQNPAPSLSGNQIGGKFQDVRRNLTEFTRRAAVPPPRDFQDIYKQNVLPKSGTNHGTRKFEGSSFENIKANLRQIKPQATKESRWSNLSSFKSIMKTELDKSGRSNVIGGAEGLPLSVFGKGIEEEETKEDETEEMKTEFIKNYGTEELGEILRSYRPEGKKQEGWFSLQELNQRLVKLRAMEEEVTQRTRRGDTFMELS